MRCCCRPVPVLPAPTTNPTTVPSIARRAFWPVLRAFERSTDKVPRITRNECCRPVFSATSTAIARPMAPRRLLWSQTECGSRCAVARSRAELRGPEAFPGSTPAIVSSQPRRSAAAAISMLEPTRDAAYPNSCARKLGSSEVTNSSIGRSMVASPVTPVAESSALVFEPGRDRYLERDLALHGFKGAAQVTQRAIEARRRRGGFNE